MVSKIQIPHFGVTNLQDQLGLTMELLELKIVLRDVNVSRFNLKYSAAIYTDYKHRNFILLLCEMK